MSAKTGVESRLKFSLNNALALDVCSGVALDSVRNPKSLDSKTVDSKSASLSLLAQHIRCEAVAQGHPSVAQISPGTVSKILAAQNLHPHRVRYYCERRDPNFEPKMLQVLHVYKQVEFDFSHPEAADPDVVRISYDEKPGIQAVGPTTPDRAPEPGEHPTWSRDYEYVRHGTVSLLAGLDLATGEVIGLVRDRHRSREFVEFLQTLV